MNTINIILTLGLILTFVLCLWEKSLLQIKKWDYLSIIQKKTKEKHKKLLNPEIQTNIINNFKNLLFMGLLILYIIYTIDHLKRLYFYLILILVYITIYFICPLLVKGRKAQKIVKFFLPMQILVSDIFPESLQKSDEDSLKDKNKKLKAFLFEGKKKNIITDKEEEMVEEIIQLKEKTAREIMIPRIDLIGIEENSTLEDLSKLIIEKKKSRILVYRERIDYIIGIIIAKDVFEYWGNGSKIIKDTKGLIRRPFYITEYMKISRLLRLLQLKKQKLAVITDEYGGISGIVTIEDILEEIVGDIYDEDEEEEILIKEYDEYYIVSGETPKEDIENLLNIEINIGRSAVTIGGVINYVLGKFPSSGEKVIICNFEFEIQEITEKNIEKIKIHKLKKKTKEK